MNWLKDDIDDLSPAQIERVKSMMQLLYDSGASTETIVKAIKTAIDNLKNKTVSIGVHTNYTSSGTAPGGGHETFSVHHGGLAGYHSGGEVESHHTGESFAGGLRSNEVFAKLLKGEYVATEGQMKNFLTNILPKISSMYQYGMSTSTQAQEKVTDMQFDIDINVEGSLDKTVVPDIRDSVLKAVNKALEVRGITRNATKFSI
jgi:hypothetical protein